MCVYNALQCHCTSSQSRTAVCVTKEGAVLADDHCDESRKPTTNRPCVITDSAVCEPVDGRWYTSEWGEVSNALLRLFKSNIYRNILSVVAELTSSDSDAWKEHREGRRRGACARTWHWSTASRKTVTFARRWNSASHSTVHVFVTSRIDYGNALLANAQLTSCSESWTLKLEPDWRSTVVVVAQRVISKLCTTVYKCLYRLAPQYVTNLCVPVSYNFILPAEDFENCSPYSWQTAADVHSRTPKPTPGTCFLKICKNQHQ